MTVVTSRRHGRPIVAGCPDGSTDGALSLDLAELFARAARASATACVIRPAQPINEALFALEGRDDGPVQRAEPNAWLRARWAAASAVSKLDVGTASAAARFWLEIHRELRRHIGDQRLPYALRTRLRRLADRALGRSTDAAERGAAPPWPRRLLREPVDASLPAALADRARAQALAHGVPLDARLVIVNVRARPSLLDAAVDALTADGLVVVRLSDPAMGAFADAETEPPVGPNGRPAVIDLTMAPGRSPALDVFLMLRAVFVVCDSADVQQTCYATNTPCLRLGADDPVAAYPIRADGLFTLASVVELDTGRALQADELLSETYLRRPDRFAHRPNTAAEILAAVREMQSGVTHGWTESDGQARFRTRVVDAATQLATRVPHLRTSGPDDGFIGAGRLARVQADTVA